MSQHTYTTSLKLERHGVVQIRYRTWYYPETRIDPEDSGCEIFTILKDGKPLDFLTEEELQQCEDEVMKEVEV